MIKQKNADLYKSQKLNDTWSFDEYDKYSTAKSSWTWGHLPFTEFGKQSSKWDDAPSNITGSILEIGSASGGAYDFMKESGLIDLSDYTGLEISQQGHELCKKKHPGANWLQADATTYQSDRTYDYVFERIAMHHMPQPLSVMDNFSKVANKAFSTSFVSCLNGDTISDLSVARYRHPNADFVYFNIINVFEVIELLYQNGFNRISFTHNRLHEKVEHDPLAHQYVSPDVDWNKRIVSRCTVVATKDAASDNLEINTLLSKRILLNRKIVSLIKDRVKRMCGPRSGILYSSAYHDVD